MTFTTRFARPDDYPAFARLCPELDIDDPVPPLASFIEQMLPDVVVLCAGDAVVGYAFYKAYGHVGHVRNIVVDAAFRGQRGAAQLFAAMRDALKRAGCTRWYLNVKVANLPAQKAYVREGFAETSRSWVMRVPWEVVDALPEPGHPLDVITPDASLDARIAAHLRVEDGRIAQLRADGRNVLVGLWDGELVQAFASFSPTFPGIYPFRVSDPSLMGQLLRACAPHRDPSRPPWLQIPVEADRASFVALREAGALLVYALLRMEGTL